jgi:hypothetical protein
MTVKRTVPELTSNEITRLWHGIDARGGGECWPWKYSCTRDGYGQIEIARDGRRQNWATHILMFAVCEGQHTPGLDVMHSCDNRKCCNPAHLSQGTRRDNMQDAKLKGRLKQLSTITEDEVVRMYNYGYSYADIQRKLKVSRYTIYKLLHPEWEDKR